MSASLKLSISEASRLLYRENLLKTKWWSITAIDREHDLIASSPADFRGGILEPADVVILSISELTQLEGSYQPAYDFLAHLELYQAYPQINAIVRTQSKWATVLAMSGRIIPPMGVMHSDLFYGEIPCTKKLSDAKILTDYMKNLGISMVTTLSRRRVYPTGAILVNQHGPYTWGNTALEAAELAVALEDICAVNSYTRLITSKPPRYLPLSLNNARFFAGHEQPVMDQDIIELYNGCIEKNQDALDKSEELGAEGD